MISARTSPFPSGRSRSSYGPSSCSVGPVRLGDGQCMRSKVYERQPGWRKKTAGPEDRRRGGASWTPVAYKNHASCSVKRLMAISDRIRPGLVAFKLEGGHPTTSAGQSRKDLRGIQPSAVSKDSIVAKLAQQIALDVAAWRCARPVNESGSYVSDKSSRLARRLFAVREHRPDVGPPGSGVWIMFRKRGPRRRRRSTSARSDDHRLVRVESSGH